MNEIKYPEEYIPSSPAIVYKYGKPYLRTAHYKLAYYTYEEYKEPNFSQLKLERDPDIIRVTKKE